MHKRGYILLESVTAGLLLGVALSTSVSIIAHYRVETTMAGRVQEATALAIATADSLVSDDHTTHALTDFVDVPGHPNFRVRHAITTSGLETQSTPPLADAGALHRIQVIIEYPTSAEKKEITFERLKRRRGGP